MSLEQKKTEILQRLQSQMTALSEYQKFHMLDFVFTEDEGYNSRKAYKKHWDFMQAGSNHRFRMLSGGNGSGKSYCMGTEISYHVTGLYPKGWTGKVIKNPKSVWIVAETGELFRDSLQKILFGNPGEELGTGLIPHSSKREDGVGIIDTSSRPGVPGGIGSALIRHKNGGAVSIILKTFDMRRENLQAATIDLVAFDEEPPEDVYSECIMRTRGTRTKEPGISMLAFTPLKGLTDVVMRYLPNGQFPETGTHPEEKERYSVAITWKDAPHLTEEDKQQMIAEIPSNLRASRTQGVPTLGAGRIYPILEEDIVVHSLKIGPEWKRAYGLDFGWQCTAAIWGAKDPTTGILYLYGEYYRGQQAPFVHASSILARGRYIIGAPDPAGGGTNQKDGSNLINEYINSGLNLAIDFNGKSMADNTVNAGIGRILNMLETGMLKVCYNLENWLKEFRVYRYDPKDPNRVARNQQDHLMDATRYLISIFDQIAVSPLDFDEENKEKQIEPYYTGRNSETGY
jgi:phage terminase large subunit-like protein